MGCSGRIVNAMLLGTLVLLLLSCVASDASECTVNTVPIQPNFDVLKFTGTWYMLAMLKGTSDIDSGITHLVIRSDNHMSSHFVSTRGGTCQPEMEGRWNMGTTPGDFFNEYGVVAGPAKIVYVNADYTYAIVYQCFHLNTDGSCAMKFIDYLGRNPEFPATMKTELDNHLTGLCVTANDFKQMSPNVPNCLQAKAAEYKSMQNHEGMVMNDSPVMSYRRYRRAIKLAKARASLIDGALELDEDEDITPKESMKSPGHKGI